MGKNDNLTLNDVGELIYRSAQDNLFRNNIDHGAKFFIQKSDIQELMTLEFPDKSRLLIKLFPHKNYNNKLVYRIEVYKTKEGDLRGNKIAFLETQSREASQEEIVSFVDSFLTQIKL
jgi:hypothetical protein